jgi:hypothetical protein
MMEAPREQDVTDPIRVTGATHDAVRGERGRGKENEHMQRAGMKVR